MHVNIPRAVAPDYDVIPESTVTAAPRSKHSKDVSILQCFFCMDGIIDHMLQSLSGKLEEAINEYHAIIERDWTKTIREIFIFISMKTIFAYCVCEIL